MIAAVMKIKASSSPVTAGTIQTLVCPASSWCTRCCQLYGPFFPRRVKSVLIGLNGNLKPHLLVGGFWVLGDWVSSWVKCITWIQFLKQCCRQHEAHQGGKLQDHILAFFGLSFSIIQGPLCLLSFSICSWRRGGNIQIWPSPEGYLRTKCNKRYNCALQRRNATDAWRIITTNQTYKHPQSAVPFRVRHLALPAQKKDFSKINPRVLFPPVMLTITAADRTPNFSPQKWGSVVNALVHRD